MNTTYICTDSDCAQYRAKISDIEYSFIEYQKYPDSYVVCHAVVDLTDFDFDGMEALISPYYGSLDAVAFEYGFRGAFPIIAECIFEQFGPRAMEFNMEFATEQEARDYIECWIKQQYRRK